MESFLNLIHTVESLLLYKAFVIALMIEGGIALTCAEWTRWKWKRCFGWMFMVVAIKLFIR